MTTEFSELLPFSHDDKAQIWIIGTREQVIHIMNEFCVKQVVSDRAQFSPLMPARFMPGKLMAILER